MVGGKQCGFRGEETAPLEAERTVFTELNAWASSSFIDLSFYPTPGPESLKSRWFAKETRGKLHTQLGLSCKITATKLESPLGFQRPEGHLARIYCKQSFSKAFRLTMEKKTGSWAIQTATAHTNSRERKLR